MAQVYQATIAHTPYHFAWLIPHSTRPRQDLQTREHHLSAMLSGNWNASRPRTPTTGDGFYLVSYRGW